MSQRILLHAAKYALKETKSEREDAPRMPCSLLSTLLHHLVDLFAPSRYNLFMSGTTESSGAGEIPRRALSELEARVLFVIRRDGEVGLTHDEITAGLASDGYKKKAGYIRRVVKTLEARRLLERSMKPGPKKLSLAFSIPKDGVNSRRITSLILLELMRQGREEDELPEREEFIELLLALKISKKSGKLLTKSDIVKAIEFCESNGYIENSEDDNTIRAADRTKQELPFIKLIALGEQPVIQERATSKKQAGSSRKRKQSVRAARKPAHRNQLPKKKIAS
jgi:hypothetical protein